MLIVNSILQATVRFLESSICINRTLVNLARKPFCSMSRSHTRANCFSAGARLLVCVLISLFSGAELQALATESHELSDGTNSVVRSNTSLPHVSAARKSVSPLLQKRFKRQSLDQALLTSPSVCDSQAGLTWSVLSTDNRLPYGFNFICAVSERGPPALV